MGTKNTSDITNKMYLNKGGYASMPVDGSGNSGWGKAPLSGRLSKKNRGKIKIKP